VVLGVGSWELGVGTCIVGDDRFFSRLLAGSRQSSEQDGCYGFKNLSRSLIGPTIRPSRVILNSTAGGEVETFSSLCSAGRSFTRGFCTNNRNVIEQTFFLIFVTIQ
jgi:hypothetical protein